MDSNSSTTPNWILELSQVSGIATGVINSIRRPAATPIQQGATGVQVSTSPGTIAVTTSPLIVVAAVAGLVLVVWMATK